MYQILKQIITTGIKTETPPQADESMRLIEQRLQQEILDTFGGALAIRQVDAGSCNGCELEIHAVNNAYYNIEGLGIKFVASPRHADLLLVTGRCRATWRSRSSVPTTPRPSPSWWSPLAIVPATAAFSTRATPAAAKLPTSSRWMWW